MNLATREDILTHLRTIVGEVLGRPNLLLTESTTAKDVEGWDSLSHIQIIVAIENFFEIRLHSTEIAQLKDTGSLIDIILTRRRE